MKTKAKKKSEQTVPKEPTVSSKEPTKNKTQKSRSPSTRLKPEPKGPQKSTKAQDKGQKEGRLDGSWAAGLRDSSLPADRGGKYRSLTKD